MSTNKVVLIFAILVIVTQGYAQTLIDYSNDLRSTNSSYLDGQSTYGVSVDLISFPESVFEIQVPGRTTVFGNSEVWFYAQEDTLIRLPLASVKDLFSQDNLDLIFVGNRLGLDDFRIQKVLVQEVSYDIDQDFQDQIIREGGAKSAINNVFFVGFLLILFLIAIYRLSYPFLFASLTQPLSLLNAEDFSQSGSLQKFFSSDILIFVMITNLLLGMISMLGLLIFQESWVYDLTSLSFWPLLSFWLLLSFGFFLITILKFSFLRTIAFIFDLGRVSFSHFFYLLKILILGSASLLLVMAFFLVNQFEQSQEALSILLQIFFWIYLIGVAMLFFIMSNRFSFNKYHLFTYLCIAEMVPFLMFSKIIMNLGL